ncbi:hypothetical protein HY419_00230 [candidate division WWE3 bacterium]|nr:hypothetical protein [candidate division WWE3 bacterium]
MKESVTNGRSAEKIADREKCIECAEPMTFLKVARFGPNKGKSVWWCKRCRYSVKAR